MANRRQRRRAKKDRRQAPPPPATRTRPPEVLYARPADRVERLTYTRRQAAEALGVSVSTIDRRVVPVLDTFYNEWGMRLIPVEELERYIAEHKRVARAEKRPRQRPGRRSNVSPAVVARIRREYANSTSLAEIARGLNADGIETAQGGRRWWPSTVRHVLERR
ncbi:MAG: recombinase family protein [Actinobacteria bacterium]|nr:recombinase family protein [Actinomycetota bacterium]